MNIISSKEKINRMIDGIHTILSLSEEQYNLLMQKMTTSDKKLESLRFYYVTDGCEVPDNPVQLGLEQTWDENGKYIGRGYWGYSDFSMYQILQECQSLLGEYTTGSLEFSRINEMIHTRDLSSFKTLYSSTNGVNPMLLDKIFEILSSDDMLSKFFDYNNNIETFAINGQEISRNEYLKHFGQIFGNKDKNGNLSDENRISSDFFIPNLEELKNRYSQIFEKINIDRYVNPHYTFLVGPNITDSVIRDGKEPPWEITPEIREAIFSDMPQNLSLEEQAMYIYCKMCTIFSYDEGYMYRDKLSKVNYGSTFSKEHLEKIMPGDKITCYDFSRIYVKLINELDGDITAVMILEGANEGHALAGFYTENVSATVEAINAASAKDSTNDLMKAKNGIKLRGVKIISDREGMIEQAIDKVYPQILGKQPQTIREFVRHLNGIPKEKDVPNDIVLKLQAFLEIMKSNHILGNEFTQTLWGIGKTNYFGDTKLEHAYLGELQRKDDGSEKYKRNILLRQPRQKEKEDSSREVYLIDTDTLDLTTCSEEDIITRLNSGELIYESEKHKLPGIDITLGGEQNDSIK